MASPDSGEAGDNGFLYRRIYLTADYRIDEAFSGRVRFEISNTSTTAQGRPAPFIKDLFVRWSNALRTGHHLTLGVTAPPSYTVSERFWGYRSLEATIMDRNRIVSSRDFGLMAEGRLEPSNRLRYAIMIADNEGVNQERDKDKRLYGQVEWHRPDESIQITAGVDYAGYEGELHRGLNIPVFVGMDIGVLRIGAEAFFERITRDVGPVDRYTGLSLFSIVPMHPRLNAIVRYDRLDTEVATATATNHYVLLGIAFAPHEQVHLIPNFELTRNTAARPWHVNARLTVHVDFGS